MALLSRSEMDVALGDAAVPADVEQRTRAHLTRNGKASLIAVGTPRRIPQLQLARSIEDEELWAALLRRWSSRRTASEYR